MAKITADIWKNHGKIMASIHTPKRNVSISTCIYIVTSGGTGTRRLPGSGRVLHYPALPGPGRVLRQNVAGSE